MVLPDALRGTAWFRSQTVFFEETEAVHDRLEELLQTSRVTGKRIHDINAAGVASVHRASSIVTLNEHGFEGICDVTVMSPERVLRAMSESGGDG